MKVLLYRVVGNRERYYIMNLSQNLFGDYCLEKIYGSVCNKTPTREIRDFFEDKAVAMAEFSKTLKAKMSKGYHGK